MKTIHVFAGYGFKVILTLLVMAMSEYAIAGSGGQIALQYVGKNIVTDVTGPGAGKAFTVGYYTYIAGLPQSLFSDPSAVSAATAYFTFRSEHYSFSTFANDDTAVRTVTPGFLIKLYYNQTPDQTFDDTDTFSDGQLIAAFRVITSQATRVDNAASQQGSLELVYARPFWFQGKYYTIRSVVQHGVTQFSSGVAVPPDPTQPVFAFSGSALAY